MGFVSLDSPFHTHPFASSRGGKAGGWCRSVNTGELWALHLQQILATASTDTCSGLPYPAAMARRAMQHGGCSSLGPKTSHPCADVGSPKPPVSQDFPQGIAVGPMETVDSF